MRESKGLCISCEIKGALNCVIFSPIKTYFIANRKIWKYFYFDEDNTHIFVPVSYLFIYLICPSDDTLEMVLTIVCSKESKILFNREKIFLSLILFRILRCDSRNIDHSIFLKINLNLVRFRINVRFQISIIIKPKGKKILLCTLF